MVDKDEVGDIMSDDNQETDLIVSVPLYNGSFEVRSLLLCIGTSVRSYILAYLVHRARSRASIPF